MAVSRHSLPLLPPSHVLSCRVCGAGSLTFPPSSLLFLLPPSLFTHRREIEDNPERPIGCNSDFAGCSELAFKTEHELGTHVQAIHQLECNPSFPLLPGGRQAIRHVREEGKPFSCVPCGHECPGVKQLSSHAQVCSG